jgi:hypothetical protein
MAGRIVATGDKPQYEKKISFFAAPVRNIITLYAT